MYNLGASLIKAMGFQNVDDFLTDPDQVPEEQGPDPEKSMPLNGNATKQQELEIKAAEVQSQAHEDSTGATAEVSGRLTT